MNIFGRIRKETGLNQADFARRLKLDPVLYRMAERGRKRLTPKEFTQLFEIHKEYGGSIESFLKMVKLSARRDK